MNKESAEAMPTITGWRVAADTGGTFTDAIGMAPDGSRNRVKVLSSGELRVTFCGSSGGRWRVAGGASFRHGFLRGAAVRLSGEIIAQIRADALSEGWIEVEMGAEAARPVAGDLLTLATGEEAPVLAARMLTGTLAGEPLPPMELRLGTTRGTNALLENEGARVALFLTEGFRHLPIIRDQKRPDIFARAVERRVGLTPDVWEVPGRLDAEGNELQRLDLARLDEAIEQARQAGCRAAAVSFLHAYRNPRHEEIVLKRLRVSGFSYVVGSSELRPFIHYLNRTETVLIDATLGPILAAYLDAIEADAGGSRLFVMTSRGGLVRRDRFRAKDSLLSGPAGGVAGAAAEAQRQGLARVITFDMGGTSTDVARWDNGFLYQDQQTVGRAQVLARSVRIETVAAGGGSICRIHDGRALVGPESASAQPGPASYGAGGPLTITDVHLLLGRLDPSTFSIPVQRAAAEAAFAGECARLPEAERDGRALLEGWLSIANLRMAQAIREISVRDGYDPSEYALVAFGGAGGLHACPVAEILGMRTILFPDNAGLLSAEGIAEAALEAVADRQVLRSLSAFARDADALRAELEAEAAEALAGDGIDRADQECAEASVDLRLKGQEHAITIEWKGALEDRFRAHFEEMFGYVPPKRAIEVVAARVRRQPKEKPPERESYPENGDDAIAAFRQVALFGGREVRVPVYRRENLRAGMRVAGPAIVTDPFSTLVLHPGWEGIVGSRRTLRVSLAGKGASARAEVGAPDLIARELLLHRFEGIVREMGEQLRRTALSPNIRERLDFSCALLDREGRLLVNAPHIPVHLGALGECVRAILKTHPLEPGDVVVTNHPGFGGSHLPDVTVVQGVFLENRLIAILANRAHHAEWGGRRPGSMPADAQSLVEEGVVVAPRFLMRRGESRFGEIEACLRAPPWPSRSVGENMADLHAQVAALRAGDHSLRQLAEETGATVVEAFLREASNLAGETARRALKRWRRLDRTVRDTLDDGTPLQVRVSLADGRLRVDFSESGEVHGGNLNATPAIVRSVVLYLVRLMIDEPVPLNEGLLDPVEIIIPRGILAPDFPADLRACPAVVGGNIETSQRLVDLLLEAVDLMANGPGTMNNVLFGNDRFGYYETIGGGAGAGPGYAGASGVHVHMTNTAITDPEILERRYPVRLWQFGLVAGSGGEGEFRGGDGLVREYEWLAPLTVSLLTQRRKTSPRGLRGGGDGGRGSQSRRLPGAAAWSPLPEIVSWEALPGERLRIITPGGGAWGTGRS